MLKKKRQESETCMTLRSFGWIVGAGTVVDFDLAIVSDVAVLVWLGDVPFRVGIVKDFCSLVFLHVL